jgi:hypothetical protein
MYALAIALYRAYSKQGQHAELAHQAAAAAKRSISEMHSAAAASAHEAVGSQLTDELQAINGR